MNMPSTELHADSVNEFVVNSALSASGFVVVMDIYEHPSPRAPGSSLFHISPLSLLQLSFFSLLFLLYP